MHEFEAVFTAHATLIETTPEFVAYRINEDSEFDAPFGRITFQRASFGDEAPDEIRLTVGVEQI
jgi:hypothetical protein